MVSQDAALAEAYYGRSLSFCRQELGLETSGQRVRPDARMVLFEKVGRALCDATDATQRRRFYSELEGFMAGVGREHEHRLRGTVPSLAEYWAIRCGSVGCFPQISQSE